VTPAELAAISSGFLSNQHGQHPNRRAMEWVIRHKSIPEMALEMKLPS